MPKGAGDLDKYFVIREANANAVVIDTRRARLQITPVPLPPKLSYAVFEMGVNTGEVTGWVYSSGNKSVFLQRSAAYRPLTNADAAQGQPVALCFTSGDHVYAVHYAVDPVGPNWSSIEDIARTYPDATNFSFPVANSLVPSDYLRRNAAEGAPAAAPFADNSLLFGANARPIADAIMAVFTQARAGAVVSTSRFLDAAKYAATLPIILSGQVTVTVTAGGLSAAPWVLSTLASLLRRENSEESLMALPTSEGWVVTIDGNQFTVPATVLAKDQDRQTLREYAAATRRLEIVRKQLSVELRDALSAEGQADGDDE
jgi:hypothetical protein